MDAKTHKISHVNLKYAVSQIKRILKYEVSQVKLKYEVSQVKLKYEVSQVKLKYEVSSKAQGLLKYEVSQVQLKPSQV